MRFCKVFEYSYFLSYFIIFKFRAKKDLHEVLIEMDAF